MRYTDYIIGGIIAVAIAILAVVQPVSPAPVEKRVPQATYTEVEWTSLVSAASLDGVLERCDDQKIHENKVHLKTTKRLRAAFSALAPQQQQQYMPAAQRGYSIGYVEGVFLPVVDGKPGVPQKVEDKAGCQRMEAVAKQMMSPGGVLDFAGVKDGDDA